MSHRGERLRKFFDTNGIKYAQVARDLGINKNTIHNWMSYPHLDDVHLIAISKRHPDIKDIFPEIAWAALKEFTAAQVNVPAEEYGSLSVDCIKKIDHWKNKYISLLENYNDLMIKHSSLIEKVILDKG